MKFVSKKTTAFVSAALSAGFIACSDSSTKDVAGGVTDIGNSLAYTGVVVDQNGVADARVRRVQRHELLPRHLAREGEMAHAQQLHAAVLFVFDGGDHRARHPRDFHGSCPLL